MKKIYFLALLFTSSFAFSQNLVVNGDFEGWTGGVVDTWTSEAGTTVEEESTIINGGAKSAKFTVTTQTQANTDFIQAINVIAGVTYDLSFDVYQLDNETRVRLFADGYLNYSDDTILNAWQTVTNTFTPTTTGSVNVGLRFYDTAGNWTGAGSVMYIDNFNVTAQSSPSIAIVSPINGSSTPNTDVNISLSVQNFLVASVGMGDGYIKYTIDSGMANDKFDTSDIALTGLIPGIHTVYMELVDNTGVAIVPAANATVNFTVSPFVTVATIAALRADVTTNGLGKYYILTGEAFVTYARATRNQKYIQDATAAVLIDDATGVITDAFVIGDGMTGLKAQTSAFAGLLQLNPLENITVSSTGTLIVPEVVTAATLNANIEAYESELVQINGATFTTADGTIVFANNTDYNLNDGSDIVFRTLFTEADYIGQVVPQNAANRVVLVGRSNATVKVTARNLADVTLSTKAFNAIDGLTMYPNPLKGNTLYLTSSANATKLVQIFDVLGKEVLKTNVINNTVKVSGLNAGIYMVKITEEGKTATRKLVIQ